MTYTWPVRRRGVFPFGSGVEANRRLRRYVASDIRVIPRCSADGPGAPSGFCLVGLFQVGNGRPIDDAPKRVEPRAV